MGRCQHRSTRYGVELRRGSIRRKVSAARKGRPPPLCGVDPHAYESLRSHCLQDYPEFEIVFGVADSNDAIVSVVHDLIREFPRVPIQLIVCPQLVGTNFKVSNLVQMLPAARHEYL